MSKRILEIGNVVLSTIINNSEFNSLNLDIIMNSGLQKNWFLTPFQQDIFDICDVHYKTGNIITQDSVIRYLTKKHNNSIDIITDILMATPVTQDILLSHLQILLVDYQKRSLISLNQNVSKMITDNEEPEAITQYLQNSIDNFDYINNHNSTKCLSQVRKDRANNPEVARIKTDINFIDSMLTDKRGRVGLRNEGLIFVSGLKQSGKNYITERVIENVSKTHPVLFGTLEFGADLYDENIEDAQRDGNFKGNIDNIFVFDDIYEVDRIIAEIRYQHKLNGIKLVALDSMMRMTNNNPDLKTDERRLSDMFSKLGKLSKELKIPIIIIVQSSKEDLKSSVISVKGSMNADHEAYVWIHLDKLDKKDPADQRRTVVWNKNKDTHKHSKQYLMFVNETRDFYQYEVDAQGNASAPLHNYRKPKDNEIKAQPYYKNGSSPEITTYEEGNVQEVDVPVIDFNNKDVL